MARPFERVRLPDWHKWRSVALIRVIWLSHHWPRLSPSWALCTRGLSNQIKNADQFAAVQGGSVGFFIAVNFAASLFPVRNTTGVVLSGCAFSALSLFQTC
jgi:hypothetical protein